MNLIQLSFKQNLFVICTMSLTVFAFGQNNLKQEEVNDNLIGKVVFLENEISLSQNIGMITTSSKTDGQNFQLYV